MPQAPPQTAGPFPAGIADPVLDDAPATEEALDSVGTVELQRPQTNAWCDIDAGAGSGDGERFG